MHRPVPDHDPVPPRPADSGKREEDKWDGEKEEQPSDDAEDEGRAVPRRDAFVVEAAAGGDKCGEDEDLGDGREQSGEYLGHEYG